jgi:hypothetical protein
MRTSMMLAVFSLAFAACATDDTTYQGDVLPGKTVSKALCPTGCDSDLQNTIDNGAWIPVSATAFVNAHSVVAGTNVCNSLPATGACSHACDPTGFAEALPVGTCAAMRCEFPDGGELVVGGCH